VQIALKQTGKRGNLALARISCNPAARCKGAARVAPCSVLDQSVAVADRPQSEAIRNTMPTRQGLRGLGLSALLGVGAFTPTPPSFGTAPEILIAAIAATTSTIRVGSAG